ncbi:hypothetical protein [Streptomyces sp. NPDC005435]|uniref:hypothetical protein n=1 Tax=Streptomyces sp. NPDC005435 TaxID=3154464 RepID=UPI0034526079
MDQRIGSSSKPVKGEPLTGAGFDPAFIPGLTPPAKPEPKPEADGPVAEAEADGPVPEEERPAKAAADTETDADAEPAAKAGTEAEPPAKAGAEADAPDEPEADARDEPEGTDAVDGPAFEASDRRARILADRTGVHLTLDEENCEFTWAEIAAVETESPRFGKRFTITVHTPDQRWYPIEIEAKSRSDFAQWETELDAVLDAYFEEA